MAEPTVEQYARLYDVRADRFTTAFDTQETDQFLLAGATSQGIYDTKCAIISASIRAHSPFFFEHSQRMDAAALAFIVSEASDERPEEGSDDFDDLFLQTRLSMGGKTFEEREEEREIGRRVLNKLIHDACAYSDRAYGTSTMVMQVDGILDRELMAAGNSMIAQVHLPLQTYRYIPGGQHWDGLIAGSVDLFLQGIGIFTVLGFDIAIKRIYNQLPTIDRQIFRDWVKPDRRSTAPPSAYIGSYIPLPSFGWCYDMAGWATGAFELFIGDHNLSMHPISRGDPGMTEVRIVPKHARWVQKLLDHQSLLYRLGVHLKPTGPLRDSLDDIRQRLVSFSYASVGNIRAGEAKSLLGADNKASLDGVKLGRDGPKVRAYDGVEDVEVVERRMIARPRPLPIIPPFLPPIDPLLSALAPVATRAKPGRRSQASASASGSNTKSVAESSGGASGSASSLRKRRRMSLDDNASYQGDDGGSTRKLRSSVRKM